MNPVRPFVAAPPARDRKWPPYAPAADFVHGTSHALPHPAIDAFCVFIRFVVATPFPNAFGTSRR